MSAESDLLFPQADSSLMFSDFSSFSDYEDFSKDSFLMSEIDGFALLEEYDCKDGLKSLLMSELNEFNSSLEGIKEEDEEEDMHSSKAGSSRDSDAATLTTGAVRDISNGLCIESVNMDTYSSEVDASLISRNAMGKPNENGCMPLEDSMALPNRERPLHASVSAFENLASESSVMRGETMSPLSLSSQGDMCTQQSSDSCVAPKSGVMQLPRTTESIPLQQRSLNGATNVMHVEKMPSMVAPIFHINSPLSSPSSSVTIPDGNSMLKVFRHDENGSVHHTSTPMVQPTISAKDSDLLSLQADAYRPAGPHHMVQDGPSLATMHRSRSSHALGQLRLSGHFCTCPEELSASSMQMPGAVGYASPSSFTNFQATCSPSLGEGSPAAAPIRRVFSTGDLQACNGMQICYGDNNLSRIEHANGEESLGLLKVGHYTLEERKLRLHRYRQKRNERNFSKKIKYACRKTLADSRPRIRGRFARTLDDSGEPLVKDNGVSYDDEYEEVDALSSHCGIQPHTRVASFWNVTGMNAALQQNGYR